MQRSIKQPHYTDFGESDKSETGPTLFLQILSEAKTAGSTKPAENKSGSMIFPEKRQKKWQPRKDSNLNKMNQNHLCYHYTTGLRDNTINIYPLRRFVKPFFIFFLFFL